MNRQTIRELVFARDEHKCVFCGQPVVDAHHLIERRLWADGGYHLDNLISVCYTCHLACEQTIYSVEEGRLAAGITNVIVPEHMYTDLVYDKWGNVVMDDGTRTKGELFYDDSVQKSLRAGGVLDLFTDRVKYPRTYHLPWSHPTKDDKVIRSVKHFEGKHVIVTEKMDGECTTMYTDGLHARSVDGQSRTDQTWVRNFWAQHGYDIPLGMRVCGENMYAQHSIHYDDLETYFYGFSMWEHDTCLSFEDTVEWFQLLNIVHVPVLYYGPWHEGTMKHLAASLDTEKEEGYVVRIMDSFKLKDFSTSVAKYVRPNHVRTNKQWTREFVPNKLA